MRSETCICEGTIIVDHASPDEVIPDEITPDDIVPDDIVPDEVIPDKIIPDEVTPEQVTPNEVTPDETPTGYEMENLEDLFNPKKATEEETFETQTNNSEIRIPLTAQQLIWLNACKQKAAIQTCLIALLKEVY